jgi:hypothetical protein
MRRVTLWVLACCVLAVAIPHAPLRAQDPPVRQWFMEINRDIWTPFLEGVRNDDEALYLRVRSLDYVRVQANGRLILTHSDYVDDTQQMMRRYREQGTRLTIDVRFEERITDGKSASEKGISRVVFATADGGQRTYYSRFHTISRREEAGWRVLTEYFPAPTEDVGEEVFSQAKTLDDVADFRCFMPYPEKQLRCGR